MSLSKAELKEMAEKIKSDYKKTGRAANEILVKRRLAKIQMTKLAFETVINNPEAAKEFSKENEEDENAFLELANDWKKELGGLDDWNDLEALELAFITVAAKYFVKELYLRNEGYRGVFMDLAEMMLDAYHQPKEERDGIIS